MRLFMDATNCSCSSSTCPLISWIVSAISSMVLFKDSARSVSSFVLSSSHHKVPLRISIRSSCFSMVNRAFASSDLSSRHRLISRRFRAFKFSRLPCPREACGFLPPWPLPEAPLWRGNFWWLQSSDSCWSSCRCQDPESFQDSEEAESFFHVSSCQELSCHVSSCQQESSCQELSCQELSCQESSCHQELSCQELLSSCQELSSSCPSCQACFSHDIAATCQQLRCSMHKRACSTHVKISTDRYRTMENRQKILF